MSLRYPQGSLSILATCFAPRIVYYIRILQIYRLGPDLWNPGGSPNYIILRVDHSNLPFIYCVMAVDIIPARSTKL